MSAPPNPPRRLVMFESFGNNPARFMLAPAGALLPPGVRPVVALAVVADNRRGGSASNAVGHGHAGSATPTLTAGPLLGGRPSLDAANNSRTGRVYIECHAVPHVAEHSHTAGALGLRPLFGAPACSTSATGLRGVVLGALDHGKEGVNHAGAGSALLAGRPFVPHAVIAASHSGRRRLSTECHNLADAAGHGRTAGTLGLGLPPLLGAPARFLGGSTSGTTGERLDLGDEAGEGHGEEDVYAVGLAGTGSALGPVPVEFPSSVAHALLAANHNGRRRLYMECHALPDAVGHGHTAGALGLRPLLGAPARFLGGTISGATGLRGRVVVDALDLGDGDGEGEEDVTDELRFQDAHRHIQAILHLTSLRSRIKTAVHIGLLSTGKKTQIMLDAIGHIDPTAPVYHWKIHRCHALLREVMGEDLYKEVIVAASKEDQGDFGWIVTRGNEVLHGVADFMAEIEYSILYTETWRAVERDHPIYDHAPYTLSKLIEILDEISTNINLACFKRADPWVIERMVENHALALLHLEDLLLDFDEVLATGEPVDDAKTSRELQMHYNILFACDYTSKDYMAGIGVTDTKGVLLFLNILKSMIRPLCGKWM